YVSGAFRTQFGSTKPQYGLAVGALKQAPATFPQSASLEQFAPTDPLGTPVTFAQVFCPDGLSSCSLSCPHMLNLPTSSPSPISRWSYCWIYLAASSQPTGTILAFRRYKIV